MDEDEGGNQIGSVTTYCPPAEPPVPAEPAKSGALTAVVRSTRLSPELPACTTIQSPTAEKS
jgi:hypothetical protein